MKPEEVNSILSENTKRLNELFSPYDPVTGVGSPIKRVKLSFFHNNNKFTLYIPDSMYKDHKVLIDLLNETGSPSEVIVKTIGKGRKSDADSLVSELNALRLDYDFEYWAVTCVKIQDKKTKNRIPFKLNKPQRKALIPLEEMRLEGVPIRNIILKARQWGGSTLVQVYMAWIQIRHKMNWHSAIIADVDDQARNIRGMYTALAREYPKAIGTITFAPYEGSTKNRVIEERNCIVGVGSVQKPDNLRSYDFAMCHMSEIGLWRTTAQKSPEDLAQSMRASIPLEPYTLEVLESTAKGVGNFFHKEWLSAVNGVSDYRATFIGWWEIEIYQKDIGDIRRFVRWVFGNEYATFLWELGATLEGIKWYFDKKKGSNYDDWRMKSEYPSCIAGTVRVGSNLGILPIEHLKYALTTNSGTIQDFYNQGLKDTIKILTKWGYEIICTPDHKVLLEKGEWREARALKKGDRLKLTPPMFASDIYNLEWKENNIINHSIRITPELARFIGIFMGDGSYSGQVISIACDRRDQDFINSCKKLLHKLFALEAHSRITGKKKGCEEIRVQDKSLTSIFLQLGIIEYAGYYRRNVCVPEVIWRSPKYVVSEFLKGIFETDGFNGYDVPKIGIFSKHEQFLKDIQLLLLGFNITSKFNRRLTVNGQGYKYYANTLILQGEQADLYRDNIGFLSSRKQNRFSGWQIKNITKRTKNVLADPVKSITPNGIKEVYDLSIKETHRFDAGGVVVHNCAEEAFQSTGRRAFAPLYVQNARKTCKDPEFIGELYADSHVGPDSLKNITFQKSGKGGLYIWDMPDTSIKISNRYSVSVDIGGRTPEADWSVIKVIDRYWMMEGGKPEVVATWRGHVDQDIVAWKAAQIGKFYNNGFVTVESNSLDTEGTEGDHHLTILDEIAPYYSNLYARTDPEKIRQGIPLKYGFHTNMSTKPMIITHMNGVLREGTYIERDRRACDEMDMYEIKENGKYGAVDGGHDDIVMATAINLWICLKYLPMPKEVVEKKKTVRSRVQGESSF